MVNKGRRDSFDIGDGLHIKKKRKRKSKAEVDRSFRCVVQGCVKAYGTENSLNQHIKLKHKEFWEQLKESGGMKERTREDRKESEKMEEENKKEVFRLEE